MKEPEKKRLLVVEDDELSISLMKSGLNKYYNCDFVSLGKEALNKARENEYFGIVLDIGLKEMTGIEALKEIRKLPGYTSVPVVGISAYIFEKDELFYEGGFSHFLQKPFNTEEIVEALSRY